MSIILAPGDYVLTADIEDTLTHQQVAHAFLNAGASEGEYPNHRYLNGHPKFGWLSGPGLYYGNYSFNSGRLLTVRQVIDADNATEIEKNFKNGHPHATNMKMYAYDAIEHKRPWELWEKLEAGDDTYRPLTQHPMWYEEDIYRRKPKKTKSELAAEEIQRVVREATGASCSDKMAKALVDNGYMKLPEDLLSHEMAWKDALDALIKLNGIDVLYWKQKKKVMDMVYRELKGEE